MNAPVIHSKTLIQYGFLAIPIAFAGFPLYLLAPDFYATHHGISLTVLGTLLLALRLFDAVQDPLIGWLTDKRQGRFIGLIGVAGTLLCLAIFGLFNTVLISPIIWFSLCMMLAVSAYSVLTIILGAQATLWTENPQDQTRIAAARETFGLIGLTIAVSMPLLLTQMVPLDRVYQVYSILLAVLMVIGITLFITFSYSSAIKRVPVKKSKVSLLSGFRALPISSLKLFAVYAISMLASSMPAVLVIFFVRDRLGAEHLIGVFLLIYFLAGTLAMPVWKKVSAHLGKYKTWCLANIIAVAGFMGAFFLGSGDVWVYGVVCVVSGLALGADLTLPPSLLADDIHQHHNQTFAGTHYACLAFIAKASLALASAIVLPVLDLAGFKPGDLNSSHALLTLTITYALIPCLLKILATLLLYIFFIRNHIRENHEHFKNPDHFRSSHHA